MKLAFNQNTAEMQFVLRNILWGTLLLRLEEATVFSSSNFLRLKKKKRKEKRKSQCRSKRKAIQYDILKSWHKGSDWKVNQREQF